MSKFKTQVPFDKSCRFLATTANEEFWDVSQPLLFLGEWCCRFERRKYLSSIDFICLNDVWNTSEDIFAASIYIDDLYERVLKALGDALNRIHNVTHHSRYWRIVIGPWLLCYLPVLYDRYTAIVNAFESYPDINTIVLEEASWVTPKNTLTHIQLLKEDNYNLQIYSQILSKIGYIFPSKSLIVDSKPFFIKNRKTTSVYKYQSQIKAYVKNFIWSRKCEFKTVLRDSYFPLNIQLKLTLRSFGKIWPLYGDIPDRLPDNLEKDYRRNELNGCFAAINKFEIILNQLLPFDIPCSLFEDYTKVKNSVKTYYPKKCKAIFSSIGWYFDEPFKQMAASAGECGTMLLGMQHGGNYGCLAYHPSEKHEIAITDRYYTWGWSEIKGAKKVYPFYSSKLMGRVNIGFNSRKTGILFLATAHPRYLMQFQHTPAQFQCVLDWQKRFVESLDLMVYKNIKVRLHPEDYGWDISERWRLYFHDIAQINNEETFLQSLSNSRIMVCDHLGTTYIESLSANKPTIMFWNPAHNQLRKDAEQLFDLLRNVGILFDTPEQAAGAVNSCYNNVELWWNNRQLQINRRIFCDQFAKTSFSALKEWINELGSLQNLVK